MPRDELHAAEASRAFNLRGDVQPTRVVSGGSGGTSNEDHELPPFIDLHIDDDDDDGGGGHRGGNVAGDVASSGVSTQKQAASPPLQAPPADWQHFEPPAVSSTAVGE